VIAHGDEPKPSQASGKGISSAMAAEVTQTNSFAQRNGHAATPPARMIACTASFLSTTYERID
jgi:hypothetical protein